jgi:hypothetical protein
MLEIKSAGLGAASSMLLLHKTDACMLRKILLACSHEQRCLHSHLNYVDRYSYEQLRPVNSKCQS